MFTYQDAVKNEAELQKELIEAEQKQQIEKLDRSAWKGTTETKDLHFTLRERLIQVEDSLDAHTTLSEIQLRHLLTQRQTLRETIKLINQ